MVGSVLSTPASRRSAKCNGSGRMIPRRDQSIIAQGLACCPACGRTLHYSPKALGISFMDGGPVVKLPNHVEQR